MHRIMLAFMLVCGLAVAARAQAPTPPQPPPMPKPGPEHALFKEDEGTWDAAVEIFVPGQPPMTSKGVETNTVGCGGLCLITDFKGDMMGSIFHGHGTVAYDAAKKKVRRKLDRLDEHRPCHDRGNVRPGEENGHGLVRRTRHDRQRDEEPLSHRVQGQDHSGVHDVRADSRRQGSDGDEDYLQEKNIDAHCGMWIADC